MSDNLLPLSALSMPHGMRISPPISDENHWRAIEVVYELADLVAKIAVIPEIFTDCFDAVFWPYWYNEMYQELNPVCGWQGLLLTIGYKESPPIGSDPVVWRLDSNPCSPKEDSFSLGRRVVPVTVSDHNLGTGVWSAQTAVLLSAAQKTDYFSFVPTKKDFAYASEANLESWLDGEIADMAYDSKIIMNELMARVSIPAHLLNTYPDIRQWVDFIFPLWFCGRFGFKNPRIPVPDAYLNENAQHYFQYVLMVCAYLMESCIQHQSSDDLLKVDPLFELREDLHRWQDASDDQHAANTPPFIKPNNSHSDSLRLADRSIR